MLFGIRAACIVMLVLKIQTMDKLLNEIESLRYLMDLISTNNFSMPTISNYVSKSLFIMRGINSSFKTLDGIKALVNTNDYIDCYLLIRRIRDCIMFDSFLAYDAKNNHHIFDEDIPLDLETEEGRTKFEDWLAKCLEQSAEYDANDKRKKDIEDWQSGSSKRREWIGYRCFLEALKEDPLFKELYTNYLKDDLNYFANVTNGFTHALSVFNLSPQPNVQDESERLTRLIGILEELLISNFMLISSSLFADEDYMDMIAAGIKPKEGSQYLLAPCVYSALSVIRKRNPGLYTFLQKHNSDRMLFED